MRPDGTLNAYCTACGEPTRHRLLDAGSCACVDCGRIELMVSPLAAPVAAQA